MIKYTTGRTAAPELVEIDINKIQTMEQVRAMFHIWACSFSSSGNSKLQVGVNFLDAYPALKELVTPELIHVDVPHNHAEVLVAIATGKLVQYHNFSSNVWNDWREGDVNNPIFQPNWAWRIKP